MKKWLLGVLLLLWLFPGSFCCAEERETKENTSEKKTIEEWQDSIPLEEAEQVFEQIQGKENDFSLQRYVQEVIDGKTEFSFSDLWQKGIQQVAGQLDKQKSVIFRILALGLLAGIFMNFAGTVGERDLGETGFYITFLLLFATMSSGFHTVYSVASEAMENLLTFMKALIPSFSLTLCFGSSTGTSVAFYETMLIIISLIEMLMVHIFLPGVQVYFLISMVNQLADNRFSRMAELVRSFLRFSMKLLFGLLIGYQGIQGMLLPVMDKVKNNAMLQTAKGLPGVGNTLGSLADTLFGSGMLIKSAVGVGGLLCILVLVFYPLIKLLLFTAMYRIGGAVVQPISDKRIVAALQATAESGKLLLGYLFAGALMFLLSIIIILVCTNMV